MLFLENLEHALNERDVSLNDFREVAYRLLERQVIYRPESTAESVAYDMYLRIEDLLQEYFAVLSIHLIHNPGLNLIVAYPPGSQIPGHKDSDAKPALQKRIRADEAGMLVLLRLLYEEKLREGNIAEDGTAFVSLEDINTRYNTLLKRSLPKSDSERQRLFSTLKKLRVLQYEDLSNYEKWIGIREVILHFTMEGVIKALDEVAPVDTDD